MSQLRKWLVVGALISAIGGQWAVLQSVAWVGMVFKYSQNSTVKEALVKTFDGHHPCQICLLVAQGKKAEKKQAAQKLVTKIDFFASSQEALLAPPAPDELLVHYILSARLCSHSPPLPPPRLA